MVEHAAPHAWWSRQQEGNVQQAWDEKGRGSHHHVIHTRPVSVWGQENAYKSYASIAGRALSAEVRILAWSGRGLLQNGDGSRNGTMPDLMDCVLPRSVAASFYSYQEIKTRTGVSIR